jgi:hypothetical protein
MRIKSGGGISSNKTVQSRSGYKVEPKSKAINPASVSTLGISTQFKKPNLEMGSGYRTKPEGDTGLRGNYNSATSGPGSQRTTYKAGSQSATPAPRPITGHDILSDYGPESVTSRGKR